MEDRKRQSYICKTVVYHAQQLRRVRAGRGTVTSLRSHDISDGNFLQGAWGLRITAHPASRLLVQKDHVCKHKLAFQIEKGHIEGLRSTG